MPDFIKFLNKAAGYFERRDHGGEDYAFWANLYNADMCRKSADEIDRLRRELEEARGEAAMLQDIIDSRPAINAGLPESYIRWSQSIYSGEAARAALLAGEEGR